MKFLFNVVYFGGRPLLMDADDGAGSGGGSSSDDDTTQDDNVDGNDDNGDDNDDGGDEDDGGSGSGSDDGSDLDLPLYSKRQVSQIVSGRLGDVRKQFADHPQLQKAMKMLGDIIGSQDPKTIQERIEMLHQQHMTKAGVSPQVIQQQQQTQTQLDEVKRRGIELEFDNSFSKDKEFSDAVLWKDDILEYAMRGFTLQQAYWAVAGPTRTKKTAEAASREAEQLAAHKARKQQNKKAKQVQGGDTGNPGNTGAPVISPEVKAAAEKLGMDPVEYAAYMGITTLDQAQAFRAARKK